MDNNEAVKRIKNLIRMIKSPRTILPYCTEEMEALDFAIKTVEADRWISVKERMPDKKGKCLVFTDYGDVTMDSFVDGMFVCNLGNVTHWRPLPKAPESEDK